MVKLSLVPDISKSDHNFLCSAFHDALDFVSVLEKLVQDFRSVLVAARARQSIEGQINTIIKEKGKQLESRAGFIYVSQDVVSKYLSVDAGLL